MGTEQREPPDPPVGRDVGHDVDSGLDPGGGERSSEIVVGLVRAWVWDAAGLVTTIAAVTVARLVLDESPVDVFLVMVACYCMVRLLLVDPIVVRVTTGGLAFRYVARRAEEYRHAQILAITQEGHGFLRRGCRFHVQRRREGVRRRIQLRVPAARCDEVAKRLAGLGYELERRPSSVTVFE